MGLGDWLRRWLGRSDGEGFAVLDVETTGLQPDQDRVAEIAVVLTDPQGRVVEEWSTLVDPQGPVGPSEIHRIEAEHVRGAPRFADLLGELNARLSGRALVAHNARFDLAFLRAEYARSGTRFPDPPVLDTMLASRTYLPGLQRRSLAACCEAAGVVLQDPHSALGDARATACLLGAYLGGTLRRPKRAHRRLPGVAARVRWPAVPVSAVQTVRRPPPVAIAD